MSIIWTDPSVQSALIQALGAVLAASIAAIAASVIGKRFSDLERLKNKVELLRNDLHFMLAVESLHCQQHGQKINVRNQVRKQGLIWSGKFTPGRAKPE